jgi:hypothetical protein
MFCQKESNLAKNLRGKDIITRWQVSLPTEWARDTTAITVGNAVFSFKFGSFKSGR